MRAIFVFFFLAEASAFADESLIPVVSAPPIVTSVAVRGTRLPVTLSTQVGQPYDAVAIKTDLHRLWSLERFEDIRVETTPEVGGAAVVFRVVEASRPRLHKLLIEPSTFGLRLTLPEGTPIDRRRAQGVALEAQKQLQAEGYRSARVDYERVPLAGNQADLRLTVKPGDRVRVKAVEFVGDLGLDPGELRRALRELRIRHVLGWPLFPGYNPEAVDSDLARLRSLYLSRGYFDASVRLDDVTIQYTDARIQIAVEAGQHYFVPEWAGGGSQGFCRATFNARREAERQGILDFSVDFNVQRTDEGANPVANVTTVIQRGEPYRVGRIDFVGNHHYRDATLRRNLLLEEGQLFDEHLLYRSIDRLNRSNLLEPVSERNVAIHQNQSTGVADVTIQLSERKRGAWRLSGPVGPASFAGPLEASLSSRLPPWGSGLLELSTYTASISLFAFAHPLLPLLAVDAKRRLLPVLALQRPFSPAEGWKSGFSIAPQLGWRFSALSYAAAQTQQRSLARLSGDRGVVPELPVTVHSPGGDGVMFCEPPRPRFAQLRGVATVGLRLMGALAGF